MKKFFRVEHTISGRGPYNHDWCNGPMLVIEELFHVDYDSDKHVNPFHDGLKEFQQGCHLSGFKSMAQLKRWFGSEKKIWKIFYDYGFTIKLYETPNRWDGGSQSMAKNFEIDLRKNYTLSEI